MDHLTMSKDALEPYREPVELVGDEPELTRDLFRSSMWNGDGRLSQLKLKLQIEGERGEKDKRPSDSRTWNPPRASPDFHPQEKPAPIPKEDRPQQKQDKGKGVDRQEPRRSYTNGESSQENNPRASTSYQSTTNGGRFYELSNRSNQSNRWGIYVNNQDRKSLQIISHGVGKQNDDDQLQRKQQQQQQQQQSRSDTPRGRERKRRDSHTGPVYELDGSSPVQNTRRDNTPLERVVPRKDKSLPPTPHERLQSQSLPHLQQDPHLQQRQHEQPPRARVRSASMSMASSWVPPDDWQYQMPTGYRSHHNNSPQPQSHLGKKKQSQGQQQGQQQDQQQQQKQRQDLPEEIPQYQPPNLGQQADLVDWDGPDDPEHPYNWPLWKKVLNCGLISTMTLIPPLGSSIFAPAIHLLSDEFPSVASSTPLLPFFVVSVFVLGFALGPLVFAPLSEIYGRVIIYHLSNLGFAAATCGCALAPTMGSLIGLRFLAGFFASASVSNGAGSVADMIAQEKRGFAMAVAGVGPLLGPIIGPVIGGFLAATKGWRWVFWLLSILVGAVGLAMLFCLSETYEPVLLERRAKKRRKETKDKNFKSRLDSGLSSWEHLKRGSVRPLKLLFRSPIAMILALVASVMYGYLYILFTTMADQFQRVYGFPTLLVGLSYLGLGLGCVIGTTIFSVISDRYIRKATEAEKREAAVAGAGAGTVGGAGRGRGWRRRFRILDFEDMDIFCHIGKTPSAVVPFYSVTDVTSQDRRRWAAEAAAVAAAEAQLPPLPRQTTAGEGMKPEHRFFMLPAATIVMPLGFFLYGWTMQYKIHWIVPVTASLIIGAANLVIFMCIMMYLVDGFTPYGASAVASNTVVRSTVGAVLPIAGVKLFDKLGIGWGNSLLGFVGIVLIPIAFGLVRYGEYLRLKKEIKNL